MLFVSIRKENSFHFSPQFFPCLDHGFLNLSSSDKKGSPPSNSATAELSYYKSDAIRRWDTDRVKHLLNSSEPIQKFSGVMISMKFWNVMSEVAHPSDGNRISVMTCGVDGLKRKFILPIIIILICAIR